MFVSKKNYLNIILITLVLLGLVDIKLSLFKRLNTPYYSYSDTFTTYIAKDYDHGIFARVDIQDSYSRLIITSISHDSEYLSSNCLDVGDTMICGADLLDLEYELIYVKDGEVTHLLSLDSEFHSAKYSVSREAIESEYISAPISYRYLDTSNMIKENLFSLELVVPGGKRYTLIDKFELILYGMA